MCIELDRVLWISAVANCSVFYLFYAIHNIFGLHTGVSKTVRKWSWLFFLIDILIILPVPQVIGAIWYFFGIERESACWKKAACLNLIGCGDGSFHCDDHLGDYKFLNDLCSTKTQNLTNFNSCIFLEALQSGILKKKDFVHKLYYCLRWGLQSVSSFGQGLQTSINPWENIFAVCISVSSMWLLVIFVGQMLTYSQSELVRSVGMRQKGTELEQWLPYRKLSLKLQQQIQYLLYQLQETSCFDIESLINHLPKDVGREIKYELWLELLKKVGNFGKWRRALLEDLCDFVEPVTYMELAYIVHEGDPIDKVLFVVQGNLQTYNSGNVTTASPGTDNYLKDGDICGQELVAWAQDACTRIDHFSSDPPPQQEPFKHLQKLKAFVLTADDLLLFKQK